MLLYPRDILSSLLCDISQRSFPTLFSRHIHRSQYWRDHLWRSCDERGTVHDMKRLLLLLSTLDSCYSWLLIWLLMWLLHHSSNWIEQLYYEQDIDSSDWLDSIPSICTLLLLFFFLFFVIVFVFVAVFVFVLHIFPYIYIHAYTRTY